MILAVGIVLSLLLDGCGKKTPVSAEAAASSNIYTIPPPVGKLPWPQHDPKFTRTEYDSMMDSLWIINNFGQYQGGTASSSVYFHDGIDVVLPNGTKIFAVDSGYVKSIIDGGDYYRRLVIANTPGSAPVDGWS